MSTVALPAQRTAARVAGALYLLMMISGIFAEVIARGPLIVPSDAVQTAHNLVASERLFRLGTVSNLVTFAGDFILIIALYVVLKPVNPHVAVLALFWRLAECAILAMIALNDFVAVRLLAGPDYLTVFDTKQLQALSRLFIGAQGDGYRIGLFFFALGSTAFAYLWVKSRYIPRALALLGVVASLIVVFAIVAVMIVPTVAPAITPANYMPIMIFEIVLGFWLVFKGIHA